MAAMATRVLTMRTRTLTLLAVTAALVAGGCKSAKSSNPLSPSVAGPIAGVSITAPKLLEPNPGAAIEVTSQPLTLVLENASTNGQRPLSYLIEVALDADFASKVVSREGIQPGDGRTAFKLPDALAADRTYYWRARAQDGANAGPYSSGANFKVFTPIALQQPQLVSPTGDVRVSELTPTLVVSNAPRSGPVASIVYEFQVALDEGFGRVALTIEKPEMPTHTSKGIESALGYDTRYYWRARAWEMSKNMAGPWSPTASFRTPAAPAAPPAPPSPGTPVGTGGPVKCGGRYPDNGPDVIACVAAAYPQYLQPVGSQSQRVANMDFLRDRIIETGLCGGLEFGRNAKRGNFSDPSHDFIAWRTSGGDRGYDIARDYDNNSTTLQLQWIEGGAPTFMSYPRPSCQ